MLNGIINVILENGWENKEFIAKRTEGFDELKAKVCDAAPRRRPGPAA